MDFFLSSIGHAFQITDFQMKTQIIRILPFKSIFALQINIYIHVLNCTTKDHQNLVNLSKSRFISESRNVVNKSRYRKVMEKNILEDLFRLSTVLVKYGNFYLRH